MVAAVCLAAPGALAQSWPSKAVRVIVPFTAGSGTDIAARTVVERLAVQALQSAEVKDRYAKLGAETQIFTPEQFDAYLRDEVASNAVLVKAAGIKVQ
jgi:tripartite-type tricarboxylate transporter receptor subunit TctC